MVNGKYVFRGFSSSLIFWQEDTKQWRFENVGDNDESEKIFAVGKLIYIEKIRLCFGNLTAPFTLLCLKNIIFQLL